jgi:hypothetical protein
LAILIRKEYLGGEPEEGKLTERQAAIGACIGDAGAAHDDCITGASQDAETTAITARKLDKGWFIDVELDDRASFTHPARLAGVASLTKFPINLWSKHRRIALMIHGFEQFARDR